MDQLYAALDAAWKVLAAGVLLGAGLPTLFALGVRSLAWGSGHGMDGEAPSGPPRPLGTVLAYVLFAVVVLSVLLGLTYIVAHGFGYSLGFNGILPTLTKK